LQIERKPFQALGTDHERYQTQGIRMMPAKPPIFTHHVSRTGEKWTFVCDDSLKGLADVWRQARAWALNRDLSFNSLDAKAVIFPVADMFEETSCRGK
jgi:hypothetical protein